MSSQEDSTPERIGNLPMWVTGANWIADQIDSISLPDHGIECLNIGSSTQTYRESIKPYIHELIIRPIAQRGRVTRLDAKEDCGVDICGRASALGYHGTAPE